MLSLPPAFVLSQDQTLKLDMRFNLADHYKLTEPASNPSQGQGGSSKRSTDLSLSVTTQQRVIRKDNVVHVSLSSYAHVKQHAKLSPRKKRQTLLHPDKLAGESLSSLQENPEAKPPAKPAATPSSMAAIYPHQLFHVNSHPKLFLTHT